jgi:hypothetical protein
MILMQEVTKIVPVETVDCGSSFFVGVSRGVGNRITTDYLLPNNSKMVKSRREEVHHPR